MDYKQRLKEHRRRRERKQFEAARTCDRCGGSKRASREWCADCFEEMFYEGEEFDPDEEMGNPPNTDIPRDHPSNQPKPGYRPADK